MFQDVPVLMMAQVIRGVMKGGNMDIISSTSDMMKVSCAPLTFRGCKEECLEPREGDVVLERNSDNMYVYSQGEWIQIAESAPSQPYSEPITYELFEMTCKHCGASSYKHIVHSGHDYAKCEYCGSEYMIEPKKTLPLL